MMVPTQYSEHSSKERREKEQCLEDNDLSLKLNACCVFILYIIFIWSILFFMSVDSFSRVCHIFCSALCVCHSAVYWQNSTRECCSMSLSSITRWTPHCLALGLGTTDPLDRLSCSSCVWTKAGSGQSLPRWVYVHVYVYAWCTLTLSSADTLIYMYIPYHTST